jgi:hypothetical protein
MGNAAAGPHSAALRTAALCGMLGTNGQQQAWGPRSRLASSLASCRLRTRSTALARTCTAGLTAGYDGYDTTHAHEPATSPSPWGLAAAGAVATAVATLPLSPIAYHTEMAWWEDWG